MSTEKVAPVLFELETGKPPVEFRFGVLAAQGLEERAGCAPWVLAARGQNVRALVLMLTFGLQHQDAAITEKRSATLIQRYLDRGGKVKPLADALAKAMRVSGVYGDDETGDLPLDAEEGEVDPTTTTRESA
jgi:hypothetical protein